MRREELSLRDSDIQPTDGWHRAVVQGPFKFLTRELFAFFFFFGASFRKAATARASQESGWAPPENRSVTTLAKAFSYFRLLKEKMSSFWNSYAATRELEE